MLDRIEAIRHEFNQHETLGGRIDHAFEAMQGFGFETLIYDYTPVPIDAGGNINIPSFMELRNIPRGMHEYWCDRGYFLIDPVQLLAARTSVPFFWNYEPGTDTRIRRFVTDETQPVVCYLLDHGLTAGVTIPIHMPHGGFATVTGTLEAGQGARRRDALRHLGDFGLLAHIFHETAYQAYDSGLRASTQVQLTARERQCLRYCAEGYSAKEISRFIDRSTPTVVMHLGAAAKKLGARNRAQTVALALRQGLLE
jgi:LuxR family transcriptional regulator